ncbi:ABC transporter ATP-binding protein [Pseudonocardia sp. GCM10023141]|uniref:ABC transporter ATP-binding protein n=1 Tax=Pseudonocardia sp. GCM10023141 TaxID=3252653 RepID=UPI0036225705
MTGPSAGTDPALTIEDVSVTFGGNHALRGVGFEVRTGFTGLLGANGAGKTTLLNVLSGIVAPVSGRVLVHGRSTAGLSQARIARLGVGRTFQTPKLIKVASVLDNVLLGLDGRQGLAAQWAEVFGLARRRGARQQARAQLDELGLADRAAEPVANLPLPAQKLVEIARALVCRPSVLLLDEPAAGLGRSDADALVERLRAVVDRTELAVLIIEHDVELISRLCPHAVVLDFGRVIAEGEPRELLRRPEVVEAYLGADVAAVD